jgi:hypothetical protein
MARCCPNMAGYAFRWLVQGKHVRRTVKYMWILGAVVMSLVILVLAWSLNADQQRFDGAKNFCERACIQDSGGLDQCRETCVHHPDRYP